MLFFSFLVGSMPIMGLELTIPRSSCTLYLRSQPGALFILLVARVLHSVSWHSYSRTHLISIPRLQIPGEQEVSLSHFCVRKAPITMPAIPWVFICLRRLVSCPGVETRLLTEVSFTTWGLARSCIIRQRSLFWCLIKYLIF